jgi:hypothetical protein
MVKLNSNGAPAAYPTNYAVNLGPWMILDPTFATVPQGAFYTNSKLRPNSFTDGLSKTLMAAEVKMWTAYYNRGNSSSNMPSKPSKICSWGYTGQFGNDLTDTTGHTEWADGNCQHTGFTTVFTPNTRVICNYAGTNYDVDFLNRVENASATKKNYAALTSRSYHPQAVNVSLMDGAVRTVADDIYLSLWQALSTRASGEVSSNDF